MGLLLGDIAPNFQAETSEGPISFHDWIGDDWVIFSLTRLTIPRSARPSWALLPG